jgi:acyl-CoA synthetase (AMP-forming)/AMP-acid ligase II
MNQPNEGIFPTDEQLSSLFKSNQQLMNLLMRQSVRTEQVIARTYAEGTWNQFSGRDFLAHLGRSVRNWSTALAPVLKDKTFSDKSRGPALLFQTHNTYTSWVAGLSAVLAGFDVMFMPLHASSADIRWCLDYFGCIAIVTDIEGYAVQLKDLEVPTFDLSAVHWSARDKSEEPAALTFFRWYRTADELRDAKRQTGSLPPFTGEVPTRIGQFDFISFGHDGYQKPESLTLDAFVVTANHLLLHLNTPPELFWKTIEILPLSNPFAHLSPLCTLLKNGVVGFPQLGGEFESHLKILRPTVVFASPNELEKLANHVNAQLHAPGFSPRIAVGNRLDQVRGMLKSGRALKLPESVFDAATRTLLWASRNAIGKDFVRHSLADLQMVVHGLAPARESHVELLGQMGVPVIETYGVTAASGLLSANTYDAPHLNLIGNPVSHVSFRLGQNSALEYRLNHPAFAGSGHWQETGDVAQMTPFGFKITGRRRHLFVTAGGATISPLRLEQLLRESKEVQDVCIVGDKMPYLAALVVLSPDAQAEFRTSPEKVREVVQQRIVSVNETLPRHATIKKFLVLEKPFQESLGEKLPSGSLNRLKINETRRTEIDSLYQASNP